MIRRFIPFLSFFCFPLLICVVFVGTAQAQHMGFCDSATSTADMMSCVKMHKDDAQADLSKAYDLMASSLSGEEKAAFDKVQEKWLAFRDAQCGWEADQTKLDALRKVYELSCVANLTELRIMDLKTFIEDGESQVPREFGNKPRWMNVLARDYPETFWRYGDARDIDMDCDGRNEWVMGGVRIKGEGKAAQKGEPGGASAVPGAVSVVVAIAENPVVGRPRVDLLDFPVSGQVSKPALKQDGDVAMSSGTVGSTAGGAAGNAVQAQKNTLCSTAFGLSAVKRVVEPQSTGKGDGSGAEGATCDTALLVTAKNCNRYVVYKGANGFIVAPDKTEASSE